MPDDLTKLICEVLEGDTYNVCADNGTSCMFCCRQFAHRHETRGGHGVIHTPDCWLVRASVAVGKAPPMNAAKESDITGL